MRLWRSAQQFLHRPRRVFVNLGLVMATPKDCGWDWSGDYYGPGLADHMHALGVVAANYNSLEMLLYSLFCEYLGRSDESALLFSQFKNNYRIDTLKAALKAYESDSAVAEAMQYFVKCFNICSDNRNLLMHSLVNEVDLNATELNLRKSSRSNPEKFTQLKFAVSPIRRVADDIWSVEYYGGDLFFYLLTRRGEMKPDEPHARTTLPEKPALPDNLSLLLQPSGQGKIAQL
jgi:hypothetical protein